MRQKVSALCHDTLLAVLSLLCLGYAVFASDFAEIHVQIPLLPFPIFIGEIVLIICTALSVAGSTLDKDRNLRELWFLPVFMIWVLVKAALGYEAYGPLAFRHAAMFYYIVFCAITFFALRSVRIPNIFPGIVFFTILVLKQITGLYPYFLLPGLFVSLLCLARLKRTAWKLMGLGVIYLSFPYRSFFEGGTSFILANSAAIAAACILSFLMVDFFKKRLKLVFISAVVGIVLAGMYFFAPYWEIRTLGTPRFILEQFQERDVLIQSCKPDFKPKKIPTKLYAKNYTGRRSIGDYFWKNKTAAEKNIFYLEDKSVFHEKPPGRRMLSAEKLGEQQAVLEKIAYNNVLFRLFIWRDMVEELISCRAVGGMPFGRPLRSVSIEILEQARGEWSRDGWIEPHNSFLNYIYRGGIVGLCLVGVMLFWQIRFLYVFTVCKSWKGILLASGLLYWNILACFLVIYELPYTAIPVWVWWGLTYFYYRCLTKDRCSCGC